MEETATSPTGSPPPVVVDMDRCLLKSDLFWEGLTWLAFEQPSRLLSLLAGLLRGGDAFRSRIFELANLDVRHVPLDAAAKRLIRQAKRAGRTVLLVSESGRRHAERMADRVGADGAVTPTDGNAADPEGKRKLEAVWERTPVFDYVGMTGAGDPLAAAARRSRLLDPETPDRRWGSLFRALRPHQWVKNGLLLLPIIAAHLRWETGLLVNVVLGIGSFSFLASGLYLLNDLADLSYDRQHATKRERPLASGELSIPTAIVALPILIGGSVVLALLLPAPFAIALATYCALNISYSWGLKRLLALDVILLAGLYTVRVVAGAALAEIELSSWFLAFSVFFFLSLAVLKRVVELESDPGRPVAGRSYRAEDAPVLHSVGPAAGVMSTLVYCLYITGPVRELYDRPDLLWLGLPLLLYWLVRVWLLALRGKVDDDPVVFVVRDRTSYVVLAVFLAVVFLAS